MLRGVVRSSCEPVAHRGYLCGEWRFLLLFMVSTLCDAATFLLFTILTAKVRHEGRPFGKWRTRTLVAAGLLMSVKAVISIIWPTIQLPYSNVLGTAEPCFPSLIFNRFLTELVFLCVGGGHLNTVGYCRKMQTRFSRGWHGADCYASRPRDGGP